MKQLSRIAAAALMASGLFAASQASAATICNNCLYTASGATYLGAHNAQAFDGSGFRRIDLLNTTSSSVSVTDTWIFDLSPVGARSSINANFIPFNPDSLSNFTISLFNVTSSNCSAIGNAAGTSGYCSSVGLGSLIASASALPNVANTNLGGINLAVGQYAFQVSYLLNPSNFNGVAYETAEYSGQLRTTRLPEPGSLALAGLALVGLAATVRRRKA